MFFLFNDPEGPNLLVVMGMAAIIYVLSLAAYLFTPARKLGGASSDFRDLKVLLLVILFQILLVTGFYFCLS
jgi:hypothetical protein